MLRTVAGRASRRTREAALFGGIIHLSVAGLLWVRLEFAAGGALFLYTVAGAVALGAVPAALFAARGLVTPSLVVGAALVASAASTYATYVAPATTPTPVGPTPFGWYLLGWVAVAAGALAAGGGETLLRARAVPAAGSGSA